MESNSTAGDLTVNYNILNGGFVPGTAQITRALFTVYPRADGCIRSPVDDLYLHMQKLIVMRTWLDVGMVDRRGHKNAVFTMFMGFIKQLEA